MLLGAGPPSENASRVRPWLWKNTCDLRPSGFIVPAMMLAMYGQGTR
jgi:hypothetical protein